MWFAIFLTALVGAAIVTQNSVNADLMKNTNLWLLLAAGNLLAATGAAVAFLTQKSLSEAMTEIFRIPLLVLVPGVCGLIITAGMPLAIQRIGVFSAVLLVIAAQMLAGIAWERVFAGVSISWNQYVGAALVFAGILFILRPSA